MQVTGRGRRQSRTSYLPASRHGINGQTYRGYEPFGRADERVLLIF